MLGKVPVLNTLDWCFWVYELNPRLLISKFRCRSAECVKARRIVTPPDQYDQTSNSRVLKHQASHLGIPR